MPFYYLTFDGLGCCYGSIPCLAVLSDFRADLIMTQFTPQKNSKRWCAEPPRQCFGEERKKKNIQTLLAVLMNDFVLSCKWSYWQTDRFSGVAPVQMKSYLVVSKPFSGLPRPAPHLLPISSVTASPFVSAPVLLTSFRLLEMAEARRWSIPEPPLNVSEGNLYLALGAHFINLGKELCDLRVLQQAQAANYTF